MRTNTIIFFLFILFLHLSLQSNSQRESISIGVILPDYSSLRKQKIIYLDNDSLQLFTTYRLFLRNCKNHIKKHDVDWDKELLKIIKDNKAKLIYIDSLNLSNLNRSRVKFRIASLLINRECWIYDKTKEKYIDHISVEYYKTEYERGRIFKIDVDNVILETVDGVF